MHNLEQIRAAAAFAPAQDLNRAAISRLPGLILTNGLLAAAAFCNADGGGENRKDLKGAMIATARHLAERGLVKIPDADVIKGLIGHLCEKDSFTLQRATTEALAYLSFLKRFSKPEKEEP